MLNKREWDILAAASKGLDASEIDPPLMGTEIRYFELNKRVAENAKKKAGRTDLMFVPPNDMDYDESDEPWPPDKKMLDEMEYYISLEEKMEENHDGI